MFHLPVKVVESEFVICVKLYESSMYILFRDNEFRFLEPYSRAIKVQNKRLNRKEFADGGLCILILEYIPNVSRGVQKVQK